MFMTDISLKSILFTPSIVLCMLFGNSGCKLSNIIF